METIPHEIIAIFFPSASSSDIDSRLSIIGGAIEGFFLLINSHTHFSSVFSDDARKLHGTIFMVWKNSKKNC